MARLWHRILWPPGPGSACSSGPAIRLQAFISGPDWRTATLQIAVRNLLRVSIRSTRGFDPIRKARLDQVVCAGPGGGRLDERRGDAHSSSASPGSVGNGAIYYDDVAQSLSGASDDALIGLNAHLNDEVPLAIACTSSWVPGRRPTSDCSSATRTRIRNSPRRSAPTSSIKASTYLLLTR